ncbi:MAG: hypothetical protein LBE62_00590 [Azonexus sp.]|nr:hypothetical protein [Azonexus sp.]
MTWFGLFPAEDFDIVDGAAAAGDVAPQARWYFGGETLALPQAGRLVAGYDRRRRWLADLDDWRQRTAVGGERAYPPLLWLGAPDVLSHATLAADGQSLTTAEGQRLPARLAPRLPLNRSWFDHRSLAFFTGQPLTLRGTRTADGFIIRTFWPERFALPELAATRVMAAEAAALSDWIRSADATTPFTVESLWRRPDAPAQAAGQPVLGLILNGAQGDDDEAHSGHFAVLTGRIGAAGAMADWLVNNFYALDVESEKGIFAAPTPLANYFADMNSGQAWYRPSWLLLVRLADERTAMHAQAALGRAYQHFYRQRFAYHHARANCVGISVSALAGAGWQTPRQGGENWPLALLGLPWLIARERSVSRGKALFDYLTEEQSRLYPAVAFCQLGADLLRLAQGQCRRPLSAFEQLLAADAVEILRLRLPQFPSSRAAGNWPVASSAEYLARAPKDHAQWQTVPLPPRPLPPELRDRQTPRQPPLRSDWALAAWLALLLTAALAVLLRLL